MEQVPISTHVVVVSQSGGKSPEANVNALPTGGSEGSFADLLAAQISTQGVNGLAVAGAVEGGQPAPKASAAIIDTPTIEIIAPKADEQATQQLADVLSTLPLPYLPLAHSVENAVATEAKGKAEPRLSLESGEIEGEASISSVQIPLVAEIKPETILNQAAKREEEPAIIAATDKVLPSKHALDVEVDSKQTPLVSTQILTTTRAESTSVNTPATAPVALAVDVKVGAPGWDTVFSQRVAWAATNQHQVAELRLNPPNLGPVEIRISVSNDQATATFVSPHASVRESIEAALPRLREMLGESGLTLGNVNVSSQSFQQQQQQAGQGEEKHNAKHGGVFPEHALGSTLPAHNVSSIAVGRNGLVDVFA